MLGHGPHAKLAENTYVFAASRGKGPLNSSDWNQSLDKGVYDRHRYDDEKAEALQALADLITRILKPAAKNVQLRA